MNKIKIWMKKILFFHSSWGNLTKNVVTFQSKSIVAKTRFTILKMIAYLDQVTRYRWVLIPTWKKTENLEKELRSGLTSDESPVRSFQRKVWPNRKCHTFQLFVFRTSHIRIEWTSLLDSNAPKEIVLRESFRNVSNILSSVSFLKYRSSTISSDTSKIIRQFVINFIWFLSFGESWARIFASHYSWNEGFDLQ